MGPKRAGRFWILLVTFLLIGTGWDGSAAAEGRGRRDMEALAESNRRFTVDLHRRLAGREENLALSPYSIRSALVMAYQGARGETRRQMADVLILPGDADRLNQAVSRLSGHLSGLDDRPGIRLAAANGLWAAETLDLHPSFSSALKTHYGGGMNRVDFENAADAARRQINAWVEERTHGRIKDLLSPAMVDALTRLILTNAVWFKGDWAHPFPETETREAPFWRTAAESVPVPMMVQSRRFPYGEEAGVQVLELPYRGGEISMVILLPREREGLGALESRLRADLLEAWMSGLAEQQVRVHLPRFTVTGRFELSQVLSDMGMDRAFTNADFTGITDEKPLAISAVVHQAFVGVGEAGTEAGAATAVVMSRGGLSRVPPVEFRADHPFLFLIREKRWGTILFIGRVGRPVDF